jgi:hypothetical protein
MPSITTLQGKSYMVIDPVVLAAVLRSPVGPVYRAMIERGEKVKIEAQRLAPVGTPDPLGRPKYDGTPIGNLRDHIVKRIVSDSHGITVVVGVFNVPYAYGVHEGNPVHPIYPREGGYGLLVFWWPKVNAVVYSTGVLHPGNQPNRFLMRALDVLK